MALQDRSAAGAGSGTGSGDARLEAGILSELESLVRELRGARALLPVANEASLERDLGLGSLERMELVARLERRFRRRASEEAVGRAETVHDLVAAFVDAREGGLFATSSESVLRRPRGVEPPHEARSLAEVLVRRAEAEPDQVHILLEGDGTDAEEITIGDLYRDALHVAGGLRRRGVGAGEAVAIMLPTGRCFFSAFMGTLLAGAVPVPLYPPLNLAKIAEYAARQARIVRNAEARVFLTLDEGRGVGRHLRSAAPSLKEVVSAAELIEEAETAAPVLAGWDAPALVQYTSGSTGDPKGVLLTNGNLLTNMRAIGRALAMGPEDTGVSWLPLYHDMGLIGAWLTPMYFGFPVSFLSPIAFLARPERWLWTLHRRRGTISPAPNFAYEICRRKIPEEELEGLDLSSWRVALNGAEPISPATLEGFAARFARYGFRETAFLPVYGLAEATLLLAAPELGVRPRLLSCDRTRFEREGVVQEPAAEAPAPLRFVSVGRAVPEHDVRVVDEAGGELPERQEGRLVFRGPSATSGYFRNEAATAAARRGDGFLDSGDRAFVADGELYVTGRAKDLIIKAGRNLIPQELEAEAAAVRGVRPGSVAAFGVTDGTTGTENVVVVAETRERDAASRLRAREEIRARMADGLGVVPDDVVVVPPGTLPKTSSGKLRRGAVKERYLEGSLATGTERARALLAKLWLHGLAFRLRSVLGRCGRAAFGLYVAVVTVLFVVPLWLAAIFVPSPTLREIGRRASRLYLRASGVRLAVEGAERLRAGQGPAIVVANHASYLDPLPLMAVLDTDHAFVVKREVFQWPLVGRFVRKLGHVPVERSSAEASLASTSAMRDALEAGRTLVMFPEGTFTYAAGVRPFKLGAFHLAAETGRPVVPVALAGTRRWLRDGTLVPRPGRVSVLVGESLQVGRSFGAIVRASESAAEAIARQVGEPRWNRVSPGASVDGVSLPGGGS